MSCKDRGFTLIELLVVVAIIVILASILFPVFAKARDKAVQTVCLNNLKQFGIACSMYQEDYEGCMVPVYSHWYDFTHKSMWHDLVNPYLKLALKVNGSANGLDDIGEVYRCPAAPESEADQTVSYNWYRSYGMNHYCGRGDISVKVDRVMYPSSTLRMTEAWGTDSAGRLGGSTYAPMPNMKTMGYGWQPNAPGWHNGWNSVLWIDGHVSTLKASMTAPTANCRDQKDVMYDDDGPDYGQVWCRLVGPKPGS